MMGWMLALALVSRPGVQAELQEALAKASPDQVFQVYVLMKDQPDYARLRALPTYQDRVAALQQLAEVSQKALKADLQSQRIKAKEARFYWVFNGAQLWITRAELEKLLTREDIGWVELVPEIHLDRPTAHEESPPSLDLTPWGISKINAPQLWDLGITGQGVIIGGMDTGVDTTHPALKDSTGASKVILLANFTTDADASDWHGHGTHTTGTMVGGDGRGSFAYDIGVAPGARVVHAKVFGSQGNGDFAAAFQWFADLKANQGYNIVAVNNSWGSCSTTSLTHWSAIQTWLTLDIVPVFSIGNAGNPGCPSTPAPGTAGTPGNYPTVIGVGATTSSDGVASFSLWGPAPNQTPWNDPQYWFRPDWNLTKPDIGAPGVGIYSSVAGGGYQSWDGTSMASPHVTGAIALLAQANPNLRPIDIYNILTATAAHPAGYTYPNNEMGWGRLDVLAAYQTLFLPHLSQSGLNASFPGTYWDPGELLTLDVQLKNVGGDSALSITGTLEVLSSQASPVDNSDTWPDLGPGDTAWSVSGGFTVQAAATAPSGDVPMRLILQYQDPAGTTYVDTLVFSVPLGVPRFDLAELPAASVSLTVSDVGAFPSPTEAGSAPATGNGFTYAGNNLLYYGGLALGNGFTYVVDAWYGSPAGNTNGDWATSAFGRLMWMVPAPLGDTAVAGQFHDGAFGAPRGVHAIFLGYAYQTVNQGNVIYLQYGFTNEGSTDLTGVYAGLFMDFDIDDYATNSGGVDASRNLVYEFNPVLTNFTDTAYAGVAVLTTSGAPVGNLSLVHNPTYVYNGTSEGDKWYFLNGTYSMTAPDSGNNDYSVVASVGPFTLSANAADTQYVVFGVVACNTLACLQQAVDSAARAIQPVVGVKEARARFRTPAALQVHALAGGRVEVALALPVEGNVRLALFDATGRRVSVLYRGRLQTGVHRMTLPARLSRGVYFLRAETPVGRVVRRLVIP